MEFYFPGFGATLMEVFEDNGGTRHLAQNPACTSNSKHIHVRHHLLRVPIFRGEFIVTNVESEEQHADFLTKPLSNAACCYHRDLTIYAFSRQEVLYLDYSGIYLAISEDDAVLPGNGFQGFMCF